MSFRESKKLIKSLKTGINDTMITRHMALFALATGLRYAEVAGLTYNSLDTKQNILSVTKTWDYVENRFKPTKTDGSKRVIKIEPTVAKELNRFILAQKKRQLAKKTHNPHNLIFADWNGTPPTNGAANKSLRRACKRAGIPEHTFHSLRHTHVSILLYNGMDIPSIAKRIGHSKPSTTMDVYAHVIRELEHKSDNLSDTVVSKLFS